MPRSEDIPPGLVETLLVILMILAFGGGKLGFGGAYRGPGNITGLTLVVLLAILLVRASQRDGRLTP